MANSSQRKIIFIKKSFQLRLILSTFLFFCGGCFLFLLTLALLSTDSSLFLGYSTESSAITTLAIMEEQFTNNWILFVVGGLVLIISSIFLSHRVAGPLYRFEHTLDQMIEGNLKTPIKLREKDEGKILAEKINQFNSSLSQSVRTLHQSTEAMDALLDQIDNMDLPKSDKEELASICWAMRERNRRIQKAFRSYQAHSR